MGAGLPLLRVGGRHWLTALVLPSIPPCLTINHDFIQGKVAPSWGESVRDKPNIDVTIPVSGGKESEL